MFPMRKARIQFAERTRRSFCLSFRPALTHFEVSDQQPFQILAQGAPVIFGKTLKCLFDLRLDMSGDRGCSGHVRTS